MKGDNILKKSIDAQDKYKKKYWSLIVNHARIDVTVRTVKGRLIGFSVNLSLLEEDKRFDIARWDTSHGFLHKHEFWRSRKTIRDKSCEGKPLQIVFEEVYRDLKENWEKYAKRWKDAERAQKGN